ncbi:MAG TPA: DUF4440 domain-containing protein [Candidatus Nitrosotenuis sp.]|jgi:hypothetical protein|nr:DUF4440 domain-containing protein [Candidatus Nitrosotenuis sp.]
MGEFFIIAKFQGKRIGQCVAHQIWNQFHGKWEVSVIPENKSALKFWQRAVADYTGSQYQEQMKVIDYDDHQPQRIIFTFDADQSAKRTTLKQECKSQKDSTHLTKILSDLKRREPIFHHPDEFGRFRQDILNMTCDEFWEIGASGRRYSREDVMIETLLKRYADPEYKDIWETSDFELTQIASDTYLLTYILVQNNTRRTRRSTIWRNVNGQWKILYHQGTVIEEEPIICYLCLQNGPCLFYAIRPRIF